MTNRPFSSLRDSRSGASVIRGVSPRATSMTPVVRCSSIFAPSRAARSGVSARKRILRKYSGISSCAVNMSSENRDGTWSGGFTLPALHASLLTAFLERLCSPRMLARNTAGETIHDETVDTGVNIYEQRGRAFWFWFVLGNLHVLPGQGAMPMPGVPLVL